MIKEILFTAGDDLFAVNAQTGKLIISFGNGGKVSMNAGMRDDPKFISIKPTSAWNCLQRPVDNRK
jgi:quinoprotein glucose dehydrogenase